MYARIYYIVLGLVAVLLLASCQEKRAQRFEREAREYTETNCPQQMDAVTCLDSIVFVPNEQVGELVLYYSLQLTEEQRTEMMNKLGDINDMNLRLIRNSVPFTKYREAGISFTYIYHDATLGDKIVEYHFTKEDYQ